MDHRQQIENRINFIKNSNVLSKLVAEINNKFIYVPGFNVTSRIKDVSSAVKKMQIKGYDTPDKLTDLAGIMIVTDNVSDIYKIADYLKENYSTDKPDDYIKSPKNGYRSYHINIHTKDGISVEFQIKTHAMQRAQNFIHDSIYKSDLIPKGLKPAIMKPLFPLLSNMSEESYNAKLPELYRELKRLEHSSKELTNDNIEAFLNSCRKIVYPEIQKYLKKLNIEYRSKKCTLVNFEKDLKRLSNAKLLLDDYNKNKALIGSYGNLLSKVKRFFSKKARDEYKQAINAIKISKQRLSEIGINSHEDFDKLFNSIKTRKDMQYLKIDISYMYSEILALKNIIKSISKDSIAKETLNKSSNYER